MRIAPLRRSLELATRIFAVCLLLGTISSGLLLSAAAEDDLSSEEAKKKLEETTQKLQSSRQEEQGLTKDVAALLEARAKLNVDLIEAGRRVQESEAKLSETEAKLSDLTRQVDVVKKSIAERKGTIVKMLSAMQRIGRTPPPALVTRRDDALAVVRSAMLLADVFPELKYQADNLTKELDGLVGLENGIRAQRDAEKLATGRLVAERDGLDKLLTEKKEKLTESESDLVAARRAADQQASEVTELNDLVGRLQERISKAEMAQYEAELAVEKELRARQQKQALSTPANDKVVEIKPDPEKIAFASPDRLKPARPFEAAKGALRLPVQGTRIKGFGDGNGVGGSLKGISLRTRPEARIIAPADGWVVYAGRFRSYGQLLILNAGGGYHLLFAGMGRIDASVGQFVLAGEPIAVMASSASAKGESGESRPVLYVELRKDGRPIDPGPWWAEASEKVQG
jgi:septal ring factor EnvC (AmiA/AmiB activator)